MVVEKTIYFNPRSMVVLRSKPTVKAMLGNYRFEVLLREVKGEPHFFGPTSISVPKLSIVGITWSFSIVSKTPFTAPKAPAASDAPIQKCSSFNNFLCATITGNGIQPTIVRSKFSKT